MSVDVHVNGAITEQLEVKHVDVITAQDDGRGEEDDDILLERATALDRVVFTQDEDFLAIAGAWQKQGREFAGVREGVVGVSGNDLVALVHRWWLLSEGGNCSRMIPIIRFPQGPPPILQLSTTGGTSSGFCSAR